MGSSYIQYRVQVLIIYLILSVIPTNFSVSIIAAGICIRKGFQSASEEQMCCCKLKI